MITKGLIIQVVVDLLCLFLVFLPWIVLHSLKRPFQRGFFCNDESIKYPYKDNTVTNAVLTSTGLLLAFFVFLVVELVHHYKLSTISQQRYSVGNASLPRIVVLLYAICGTFIFGVTVQQTVVNIGKFSVGRLRPHFLSVCQPDWTQINCTVVAGQLQEYAYVYVSDEQCQGHQEDKLLDSRLSFPSGHSSFAFFVAVFLSIYLQIRVPLKKTGWLMKHLFQALLIYLAFYVGLSRISDYKHHWSDVLAGAFIGCLTAALAGIHVWYNFQRKALEHDADAMDVPIENYDA